MNRPANRPFSWKWVMASAAIFIGIELLLGGVVGGLLVGRYMSLSLKFLLQGLLNLISYFVGGIIIGAVSPGLRILEPAVGAFVCVAVMLTLSLFTPYALIQFSLTKMLIGGVIAFGLALTGARIGEKLTGNRVG